MSLRKTLGAVKAGRFIALSMMLASMLVSSVLMVNAKGFSSSGRSSSSFRSVSRPSVSRPVTTPRVSSPTISAPKVSTPVKPSVPKVTTRPSTATKTVTAPKPKTVAGKTFSTKGSVVDSAYQPRFYGGYSAPLGSTVYYRDNGLMNWLPFYMIMNNQQHREAVVVQPDGKEQVVKEEGTDGMYIFNWIITILVCAGLIAGVVYLINRYSKSR